MNQVTFTHYITLWLPTEPVKYWNQSLCDWVSTKDFATPYAWKSRGVRHLKALRLSAPQLRNFTEVSYLTHESPKS